MKLHDLWQRLRWRRVDETQKLPETVTVEPGVSYSRALEWLGIVRLERQRFYEGWAAHETWLIYDEGLCLLLGRDPEDAALSEDSEFLQQRQSFWEHLQHCVSQRVPPVVRNPAESSKHWRAEPVELYRWAVAARVPMPEELETLLTFISMTVPAHTAIPVSMPANEVQGESQSLAREQVLSIMLSLNMQARHQATGESADTIRESTLEMLYAKSSVYFDDDEPPLSRPALHDLIDRSLEAAGLIRLC